MEIDIVSVGEFVIFRASLHKQDFEHMEGIFTLDEHGVIIDTNQFVFSLFGFNKNELIGVKLCDLAPDIKLGSEGNWPKRQRTSLSEWSVTSVAQSAYFRHKSGEAVPIHWKIYELYSSAEKYLLRLNRVFLPPLHFSKPKPHKPKQVGQYIMENTIGTGAFGKVKRAVHIQTHKEVAVKILNKQLMEAPDMERSKREGNILRKLNHPNIVKFLESEETDKHLYFFLELVGGTDLKTHVLQNKPGVNDLRAIFKQIASAICFCHELSIIHRDLKQSNILVDHQNRIKLIDFGLSNYTEEGKLRSTFCGSPAYAAPEMLLGTKYTGPEVDIWSLGVVLYAMVTQKLPFESVGQLIKGHYTIPDSIDDELASLIRSMLESDPVKRASIRDVISHSWLNKCDINSIGAN